MLNYNAPFHIKFRKLAKGYELDNLKAIVSLTANRAYEWFMMIPVSMEMAFGPLLTNIMSIHHHFVQW